MIKTIIIWLVSIIICCGTPMPPMPLAIVNTNIVDTNTFHIVIIWSGVSNAASYNIYQWPVNVVGLTNKTSITNALVYTNDTCWETNEWNFMARTVGSNGVESSNSVVIEYPFLNHKWQLQLAGTIKGPWTNSPITMTNPFSTLFQRWVNTTNW